MAQAPYNNPGMFLSKLGSFWSFDYAHADQLAVLVNALCVTASQYAETADAVRDSFSRQKCGVFEQRSAALLKLSAADRDRNIHTSQRFDTTLFYDSGKFYDALEEQPYVVFTLPEKLADCDFLVNRFDSPSVVLVKGHDFVIRNNQIVFREDPFLDPYIPQSATYSKGEIVDKHARLWAYRPSLDQDGLYAQFGYLLNIKQPSSEQYKQLINAIFDCKTGGPTEKNIVQFLSAVTGVPAVRTDLEVVEDMRLVRDKLIIATNVDTYIYEATNQSQVTTGQIVAAGQFMTDAIEIINKDNLKNLSGLSLGGGYLSGCYRGSLFFENRPVPLNIIPATATQKTKVRFSVQGDPQDIETFFENLDDRGEAATQTSLVGVDPRMVVTNGEQQYYRGTLAHLLDTRHTLWNEPSANFLPETVNPLQTLLSYGLQNNLTVIKIRIDKLPKHGNSLSSLQLLRELLPPGKSIVFLIELSTLEDEAADSDVSDTMALMAIANIEDTDDNNDPFEQVEVSQPRVYPVRVR